MGNTSASLFVDYDVDKYLNEISPTLVCQEIYKNRFLKTIRCLSEEGMVIVKMFIKQPSSKLPDFLRKSISDLNSKINTKELLNSAYFTKMGETDKVGFVMRQYFYSNLTERMNSHPFLTSIEKKWITFQLLKYLEHSFYTGIPHGDIKSENVMLTSWNWVYITDHAYPFKPVHLPVENNGFFSYFFDVSQRRICNIAPERFISSGTDNEEHSQLFFEYDFSVKNISLHLMDLFSVGCVIAELWTDGIPLFDYHELLSYKENKYSPDNKLEKIPDENIRDLIKSMICLNPNDRILPELCIERYIKNKTFPSYFETLFEYLYDLKNMDMDERVKKIDSEFDTLVKIIMKDVHIESDHVKTLKKNINFDSIIEDSNEYYKDSYQYEHLRLKTNIDDIKQIEDLCIDDVLENEFELKHKSINNEIIDIDKELDELRSYTSINNNNNNHEGIKSLQLFDDYMSLKGLNTFTSGYQNTPKKEDKMTEGLVIILNMLCSILKYLKYDSSKLICLDCFERICLRIDDHIILDRIVPYIVSLLDSEQKDPSPLVRAQAIRSLTYVLSIVRHVPISDINLFQDYLLPTLNFVKENETEEIVLEAYALSLSQLAESSKRFLDYVQALKIEKDKEVTSLPHHLSYSYELKEIRTLFREVLTSMLYSDSPNTVKKAVLSDMERLCRFFGQEDTEKTVLQLFISCLNTRDVELKCTVYENLIGLTSISDPSSIESTIFACAFPEMMYDESESVIECGLRCLSSLCQVGVFKKQKMLIIAEKTSQLLLHPNEWIRYGLISLLSSIADRLSLSDVHVVLIPIMRNYLNRPINEVTKQSIISSLKSPIPRNILESVKYTLEKKKHFKKKERQKNKISSDETSSLDLKNLLYNEKNDIEIKEEDDDFIATLKELKLKEDNVHKAILMRDFIESFSYDIDKVLRSFTNFQKEILPKIQ